MLVDAILSTRGLILYKIVFKSKKEIHFMMEHEMNLFGYLRKIKQLIESDFNSSLCLTNAAGRR